MGDPWGVEGFRGGGGLVRRSPILSKSSKETGGKIRKSGEIRKKSEKSDIVFFTENGLKCIRNPTKHL